jgi:hypothetical protein
MIAALDGGRRAQDDKGGKDGKEGKNANGLQG